MTTSDTRIWIVGNVGVGKKSFVAALGGTARKRPTQDQAILEYAWSGGTIAVCSDPTRWRGECARRDVVVLLFSLTDRASFAAVASDWVPLVSAQTHALLVGTHLDCAATNRAVPSCEAMELALVECDDFVEVCAARPPFEGVVYARQLLATWLSHDEATTMPTARTPRGSLSPTQRLGVRSSVWLFDPTDEIAVLPNDDVKLRPISRALFEMREAGSDRVKTQERRREQTVAKLVGRSRYHGPTESSRSMRWQAHQLQLQQQNAQRRQISSKSNVVDDHAKLASKSFLQPTKLMQHRVDEVRHRLLANLEKPAPRLVERASERCSRPRAMSTAPPPPAPVLKSPTRPRAPSLSLSPTKVSSPSRSAAQRSTEVVSSEVVLDLMSPPLAPLTMAANLSPVKSLAKDEENHDADDRNEQLLQATILQCSEPIHENPLGGNRDEYLPTSSISSEIDDILDYFDGVSLPL